MQPHKSNTSRIEIIVADKKDLPLVTLAVAASGITDFMFLREGDGIPAMLLFISVLFLTILVYKVLLALLWRIEISKSTVTFTSFWGKERVFPRNHIKWGLWKPALSQISYAVLYDQRKRVITWFPIDWRGAEHLVQLPFNRKPNYDERVAIMQLRALHKTNGTKNGTDNGTGDGSPAHLTRHN